MAATLDGRAIDGPLALTPTVAVGRSTCRVSLVVPARNEARNLSEVLMHVPDCVDEVILVDGRSTDVTVAMAKRCRPDIRIVVQEMPGKGAALRAGFLAAAGDVIVMMDADGSMSADEIPRFLWYLDHGFDLVKGSRFVAGGGSTDITSLRRWGNRALLGAVNTLYGVHLSDLCYGFCAFHRCWLDSLDLSCQRLRDRDRDHGAGAAGRPPRDRGAELRAAATKRPVGVAHFPGRLASAAHGRGVPAARLGADVPARSGTGVGATRNSRPMSAAVAAPFPPGYFGPTNGAVGVADIEMDSGLTSVPALPSSAVSETVLALVRVHTHPVGTVTLRPGPKGLSSEDLAQLIEARLGEAIEAHLRTDGLESPSDYRGTPPCLRRRRQVLATAPLITVVIAHEGPHGQPGSLPRLCVGLRVPALRGRCRRQRSKLELYCRAYRHDLRTAGRSLCAREPERVGRRP